MQVNEAIFRQYDIRGVVDRDLFSDTAYIIGQAFGTYAQSNGVWKVSVGRDNRESSPELSRELIKGIISTGCYVVDLGEIVTPMLYYSLHCFDLDGGVMVTGSHNPSNENGFKIALGKSTIHGEDIQKIKQIILNNDFSTGDGGYEREDIVRKYMDMLQEKIKLGPKKLKVAVDCGNGTASHFAQKVLKSLGCEVVPLYCDSNPRFPNHHPDPVKSENLSDLIKVVREQGADLGIAYDGDADRLGVVDENGDIIWGDKLMVLFWREILPRYPGTVGIVEVKCSQCLVDEIKKLGGRPMFYKTGHSLIKAKMKELGAVFTGEMSGHVFFADEYYGFDDAFYATGRLLRILSHSEKSLSGLLDDVPNYYSTAETRIPCDDEHKFEIVQQLQEEISKDYEVIDIDGVRVIFPDGWGLVRCSNTQPVLVARCEAETKAGLDKLTNYMKDKLYRYGKVGSFEWEF